MCENLTRCVKFSPKAAEFDLKSQISAAVVRFRALDSAPTQLHRSSHTLAAAGQRLYAAPTNLQLPQNLTAAAGAAPTVSHRRSSWPAKRSSWMQLLCSSYTLAYTHGGRTPVVDTALVAIELVFDPKIERMFGRVFAEVVFSE